jgi:hypothetical protein
MFALRLILAIAAIALFGQHVGAQSCNQPSGFLVQNGPAAINNTSQFGPGCGQLQDSGININALQAQVNAIVSSRTLLNTLTASNSATLADTTSFAGGCGIYEIDLLNLLPATVNTTLELQVQSGGVFQNTGYLGTTIVTVTTTAIVNTTTFVQLSQSATTQNTGSGVSGKFFITAVSSTTFAKHITGYGMHVNANPNAVNIEFAGVWNGGTGAVTGFQLLFNSGNITSGTAKIYCLS